MYSFRPEPEPPDRRVLELALGQLLEVEDGLPAAYRSEWRRAALAEGITAGDEDEEWPRS